MDKTYPSLQNIINKSLLDELGQLKIGDKFSFSADNLPKIPQYCSLDDCNISYRLRKANFGFVDNAVMALILL